MCLSTISEGIIKDIMQSSVCTLDIESEETEEKHIVDKKLEEINI